MIRAQRSGFMLRWRGSEAIHAEACSAVTTAHAGRPWQARLGGHQRGVDPDDEVHVMGEQPAPDALGVARDEIARIVPAGDLTGRAPRGPRPRRTVRSPGRCRASVVEGHVARDGDPRSADRRTGRAGSAASVRSGQRRGSARVGPCRAGRAPSARRSPRTRRAPPGWAGRRSAGTTTARLAASGVVIAVRTTHRPAVTSAAPTSVSVRTVATGRSVREEEGVRCMASIVGRAASGDDGLTGVTARAGRTSRRPALHRTAQRLLSGCTGRPCRRAATCLRSPPGRLALGPAPPGPPYHCPPHARIAILGRALGMYPVSGGTGQLGDHPAQSDRAIGMALDRIDPDRRLAGRPARRADARRARRRTS